MTVSATAPATGGLLISLAGVAALAQVRRPVVSTWRRRRQVDGRRLPFPAPVSRDREGERFRVDEVIDWLERTGRGNNPRARGDAAAYSLLPGGELTEGEHVLGATALLALRSLTQAPLATQDAEELLDLADEADPDDELLYTEVEQLPAATRVALAGYVDDLVDAAYGVQPALESLAVRSGARARSRLAPALHDLVGRVVAAVARQLDLSTVRVQDATGYAGDLLADALHGVGEGAEAEVVAGRRGAAIRELRRIAAIRGWVVAGEATAEPAIILARIPDPAESDGRAPALLAEVDELQLSLTDAQRALILGPAWLLCDALPDPGLDRRRDHLVRLGRLRAVVRLPAGLVLDRSRQPLGLWLLGPEAAARLEDKAITTADLTDVALTGEVLDDLVTDLVASLDPRRLGREHAYRFASVCRTATLLVGRGPLVPVGVTPGPVRPVDAAEAVLAARDLLAAVRRPEPPRLATLDVAPDTTRPEHAAYLTLADAQARGLVRVLPGARLADDLPPGPVPVVGAAELASGTADDGPDRGVDPVELEMHHPRAHRTQPGDVVFVVAPRPRARVDRSGGSVARFPTRILRCSKDAGLVPDVVARAVDALPADAKRWRGWHLPVVDVAQADALSTALAAVEEAEAAARRRLLDLSRLADALVEGAAHHALLVTTKES